MTTRDRFVKEAMTWLDTPWQHQARVKGVAVDCAMFVVGAAYNVGLMTDEDLKMIPNYPKDWHFHNTESMLIPIVESFDVEEIEPEKAIRGDVILFKVGRCESHMGIKLPNDYFIHAYGALSINKVVKMRLDERWKSRLTKAYRFKGIK